MKPLANCLSFCCNWLMTSQVAPALGFSQPVTAISFCFFVLGCENLTNEWPFHMLGLTLGSCIQGFSPSINGHSATSPIPFTSLFLTLQPSSLLMAGVFGEEKYWNRGSPEGTFLVQALKESVRGESQFQDKIRGQL